MTETECFRDAFRDQLHELSKQPNSKRQNLAVTSSVFLALEASYFSLIVKSQLGKLVLQNYVFLVIQEIEQNCTETWWND